MFDGRSYLRLELGNCGDDMMEFILPIIEGEPCQMPFSITLCLGERCDRWSKALKGCGVFSIRVETGDLEGEESTNLFREH